MSMTQFAEDAEFKNRMSELERLLQQVEKISDPNAREITSRIIQSLMDFHGAGLSSILDHLARAGDPGHRVMEEMANDDLVSNLLLLYGLHPLDLAIIVGYLLAVVYIGKRAAKATQSEDGFFLAGRKLGKLYQFFLNFGNATELVTALTPMKSARGQIAASAGTNAVIVTDVGRVQEAINDLIQNLDVRTPQVQIQAKIVFVNEDRHPFRPGGIDGPARPMVPQSERFAERSEQHDCKKQPSCRLSPRRVAGGFAAQHAKRPPRFVGG